MLDSLNTHNGQTLNELCAGMDMARQSVSKHLAILEEANLVTTLWRGREKLHFLNAEPINAIADRWITQYDRRRVQALADLKSALEQEPMDNAFVYTTYIKTTPERLWQALTDPTFNRTYWGNVQFETDWKVGSQMIWHHNGFAMSDPRQVVLAFDPPKKLAFTYHMFPADWAKSLGIDDELLAKIHAEKQSKVSFDIEPQGDNMVKLTVVQDGFDTGSVVLGMINDGMAHLVSSLKSQLETGEPLPSPVG